MPVASWTRKSANLTFSMNDEKRALLTPFFHWKILIVFIRPAVQYPCPCCGYIVFRHKPGNHETCPICCWEDDLSQLRFVEMVGGVNDVSLVQAQQNYQQYGSCSRRKAAIAQEPLPDKKRDTQWRPVDLSRDNPETPRRGEDYATSYPYPDTTVLYYWRPAYWRRLDS